jgi:hypothetical protein
VAVIYFIFDKDKNGYIRQVRAGRDRLMVPCCSDDDDDDDDDNDDGSDGGDDDSDILSPRRQQEELEIYVKLINQVDFGEEFRSNLARGWEVLQKEFNKDGKVRGRRRGMMMVVMVMVMVMMMMIIVVVLLVMIVVRMMVIVVLIKTTLLGITELPPSSLAPILPRTVLSTPAAPHRVTGGLQGVHGVQCRVALHVLPRLPPPAEDDRAHARHVRPRHTPLTSTPPCACFSMSHTGPSHSKGGVALPGTDRLWYIPPCTDAIPPC